jgi:hypothetical protein
MYDDDDISAENVKRAGHPLRGLIRAYFSRKVTAS